MSERTINRLHNVNVVASELLPTPEDVKRTLPLTSEVEDAVYQARGVVRDVMLVDEREPVSLTSARGTQGFRNWFPGPDDAVVRLMNRSIARLEEIAVVRGAQPDPGAGWNSGCGARGHLYLRLRLAPTMRSQVPAGT